MKKLLKRFISFILVFCMIFEFLPFGNIVSAAGPETYSLANGNIEVTVSAENGGFAVRTVDGDSFSKDDNNKDLLFRNGEYDTSFTSFRVTEGTKVKEYIFGGNYSFLGLGENTLEVKKENDSIVAAWSVDELTFTQIIQPVWNEGSNEHGTVAIYYMVENGKDTPVDVEARLLLDTALGSQDYGFYELALDSGGYNRLEKECIIDGEDIPANFFAYDNFNNPSITAYSVNDTSAGGKSPYKAAFGHWNNLGATIFDFNPDTEMTFTNRYNKRYLTADSAYALYYDLGTVPAKNSEAQSFLTYYGVYSNADVAKGDRFSVNITSPTSLTLSSDKKNYTGTSGRPDGIFEVTTNIGNIIQEGAVNHDKIAVAVYVDEGLDPLNERGESAGANYNNPYRISIDDFKVGEVMQLTWKFRSEVFSETGYRKMTFKVYNMPESANNMLLLENVTGSATAYVLCPGGSGRLPEILFTGASPEILYNEGTRHLYLAGSGFNMLKDTSRYVLKAYPESDSTSPGYTIPSSNIIFTGDEEKPTIDVVMTEVMELDEYYLVFEWASGQNPTGIKEKLTAPALKFTVTDDKAYKNDYYGIAAIVKPETAAGKEEYHIEVFPTEAKFKEFRKNYEGEVLFEIKGEFTVEKGADGTVRSCKAVSLSDEYPVNINGVLDLINGDVAIILAEKGDGTEYIYTDMEGEILTSNSRTPVWNGIAYITPLVYGEDYGLIAYDESGIRLDDSDYLIDNEISLVWSSEYKILQTIGGMAVDLRYGQFGKMYDEPEPGTYEEMGYVLSFGASLDVSKLMPKGKEDDESGPLPIEVAYAQEYNKEARSAKILSDVYNAKQKAKAENEANKTKPVGKVNIEDILYGLDKGYIGFNAEAELTLPKYADAISELSGRLAINTINGYRFEVEGGVETATFEMEFELQVRSAPDSGVPVPDKIFFRIAGFEPGFNVDGAGTLWLTGGGGGIDKLYDTIFATGLPPLTLLITADFDILKVMSARADLSLSLRGFRISISDVKLKGTDLVVIKSGQLALEWYPDFYLLMAASMELLGIIEGSAYIVVDNDFFEFFMRVGVKIPKAIPIVGGIVLVRSDLGANNDRIWGAVSLLGLKVGICYYWGGDFSFGTGGDTIQPTYPELLGFQDMPVGYDERTGKTLYLRVGTNMSLAAQSEVVADLDSAGLVLMAVAPSVKSNAEKKLHKLNLGDNTGNDFAFSIDFGEGGPSTIPEAQAAVAVTKPDGVTAYPLTFYDPDANGGAGNVDIANANFIYDEKTGKRSISVAITEYIAGDWNITTTTSADIVLYNVAVMPEVDSFTAAVNGGKLDLIWAGSKLNETKINFYVTSDIGDGNSIGDMGTYIGSVEGTPDASGQAISLALPADLKSDTYYVRMTVSKEEEMNDLYLAKDSAGNNFTFDHINTNQPDEPDNITVKNIGNLMFDAEVSDDQSKDKYDGYIVNVYEDGAAGLSLTELIGLSFDKGNDITVGGTYKDINGKTYGLTAGKSYVIGAAAFKTINPGTDDENIVYGKEKLSAPVTLNTPDPPEITFRADAEHKALKRTVMISESESRFLEVETFTTNDVELTLFPNQEVVRGEWYIDSMNPKTVNNVTVREGLVVERYMPDGDHIITFMGKNNQGDSFIYSKLFSVDTTPPRLMLTSPTNGSSFSEAGVLNISGITDTDAIFTIKIDDEAKIDGKTLAGMGHLIGADGTFGFDLVISPEKASHRIDITVEDKAGNSFASSAVVHNSGLSDISRLDILRDGILYSDNNITLNESGTTTGQLSLRVTTGSGEQYIIKDDGMVSWTVIAKEGSVSIDRNGLFNASPGSVGFAEASFHVAEDADMTAAITFGAEKFANPSDGSYMLILASTIGGTVTGGGNYLAGASVTLKATANSGYRFVGWSSENGGSFADADSATTIFTMPANNTTVTAGFVHISVKDERGEGTGTYTYDVKIDPNYVKEGAMASILIPAELLGESSSVVPYYMLDGAKHYVINSAIIEGKLVFIAPVTGEFKFEVNKKVFSDTFGHWAKRYIDFVASRGLLQGVGDNRFDPNVKMTRAMFATILARLDGVDMALYRNTRFTDVKAGSWYESAVAWAQEAGIVKGTGGTEFAPYAPITREQMAVMLANYIAYKGYKFGPLTGNSGSFADSSSISTWAANAISLVQGARIMNGKPGKLFDPGGITTRAEGCAVFMRLIEVILKK